MDIESPKNNIPEIDIHGGNIGGYIQIPKVNIQDKNLEGDIFNINVPQIGLSNIIENQPLNIRSILSGNIDDPIILNKHTINIPDVTVGVRKPNKNELDIISGIDIKEPKLDINVTKIDIPNIDVEKSKIE